MDLNTIPTKLDLQCLTILTKWYASLEVLSKSKKISYKEYLDSLDQKKFADEVFKYAKFEN